jgi:hypothetical protein
MDGHAVKCGEGGHVVKIYLPHGFEYHFNKDQVSFKDIKTTELLIVGRLELRAVQTVQISVIRQIKQ